MTTLSKDHVLHIYDREGKEVSTAVPGTDHVHERIDHDRRYRCFY